MLRAAPSTSATTAHTRLQPQARLAAGPSRTYARPPPIPFSQALEIVCDCGQPLAIKYSPANDSVFGGCVNWSPKDGAQFCRVKASIDKDTVPAEDLDTLIGGARPIPQPTPQRATPALGKRPREDTEEIRDIVRALQERVLELQEQVDRLSSP